MQSFYEINVSRSGMHFFATAPRSGTGTEEDARCIFDALKKRFTEEDGYRITCTHWECSGKRMSF